MTDIDFSLPGLKGRFTTDKELDFGMEEELLFKAHVPGIEFTTAKQEPDMTIRYIESSEEKLVTKENLITIQGKWEGRIHPDLYHLTYGIARRHYLDNNLYPVHAACVGLDELVLIAGHSGSGKTTTALKLIKTGMKLYSGNKTVLDLKSDKPFPIAGTTTITVRDGNGSRNAYALEEHQYSPAKDIGAVVLIQLNDGVREWEQLNPASALHTLYPLFLDTVNADVVICNQVYDGSVSGTTKTCLAERLGRTVHHLPVYSAAGPLEFIVNKIMEASR